MTVTGRAQVVLDEYLLRTLLHVPDDVHFERAYIYGPTGTIMTVWRGNDLQPCLSDTEAPVLATTVVSHGQTEGEPHRPTEVHVKWPK